MLLLIGWFGRMKKKNNLKSKYKRDELEYSSGALNPENQNYWLQ